MPGQLRCRHFGNLMPAWLHHPPCLRSTHLTGPPWPGLVFSCRDVRDTYLPAFRACVTEARAASVMCSYNAVNGTPACASDWLLREVLRGDMGFRCGSWAQAAAGVAAAGWPCLLVGLKNVHDCALATHSAWPSPKPLRARRCASCRGFVVSDCGAVQSITGERS